MSDDHRAKEQAAPGFWRKLLIALEGMDDSYAASLEARVHALEVEVARLGALEKEHSGLSAPEVN